jgi:pimeloyl-ACP methyl ester carboxylesterase
VKSTLQINNSFVMFKHIILLLFVGLPALYTNAQKAQNGIVEEPVLFSRGDATYAGVLSKPAGKKKLPLVILISGMGLQNLDWEFVKDKYKLAKMLSDSLNREGMAVLRYDDRGFGQSTGNKETVTGFADLAEDVYAAVVMLRKRADIGKIGLMGHSLGGILSMMAAARHLDIDFVITLAGSFQTGGEIMMEQARTLKRWRTSGTMTDADVVQNGETFVRNWVAYSGGQPNGSDTMKMILKDLLRYQIRTMSPEDSLENMQTYKDTATMLAKVYEEVLGYYTSPHQQSFAVYNPIEDFRRLTCPVLVLFGEKDKHVTVQSNLPKVAGTISEAGMGNVTIHIFQGTDHSFSAAGGVQTGKMTPALAARVACWIKTFEALP